MTGPPLRFAFAVHVHQPVGNFDHVFAEHLEGVYRPFLAALHEHHAYPITLHVSGPLIDWLELHAPAFLDEIGRRVDDGNIEMLASGKYEPILAALSPRDRVEQVEWMRADLESRFGAESTGLWLTERVWEPDLSADLAAAGIRYTLLDDRHLLACGLERRELDRPFATESGGGALKLLPIDERLRYLIPFRPVPEIVDFLLARRREGFRQIILGDDGEKFGGWPDTAEWVYAGGWLTRFLNALDDLRARGEVELSTTGDAAATPSGGLVYPTSGSYREMEEWTLPRPAALRLEGLTARSRTDPPPAPIALVTDPSDSGEASGSVDPGSVEPVDHSALIRGGHWKGFLRKYTESNRMHKTALQLSALCHERGDPEDARRAIGRAQCNDAYWHGVFGGVYLPHLRQAVWRELARAERILREGEALALERLDFNLDGHDELWIHSAAFSAVLAPARGGAIEVLMMLEAETNLADVLTRRLEAYHAAPTDETPADIPNAGEEDSNAPDGDGIASVHVRSSIAPVPPGVDERPRALFQEVVVAPETGDGSGDRFKLVDWAARPFTVVEEPRLERGALTVRLASSAASSRLDKRLVFHEDGSIEVSLDWNAADFAAGGEVVSRLSLSQAVELVTEPSAAETRRRIMTLARSERGFERIDQGESIALGWPVATGHARIELVPRPA